MLKNISNMFKINKKNYRLLVNNKDLLAKYNKKIFTADVQRPVDKDRIKEITKYQENYFKKNKCFNFLGSIVFCEYNNKYFLIDGQHRYESILKLTNKTHYPSFNICLEVLKVANEEEIEYYFNIVNKNIYVPELPKGLKKSILINVNNHFLEKYKQFFKNSKKPRKPNIRKNTFLEEITRLINKLNPSSDTEIIKLIEKMNNLASSLLSKHKSKNIGSKKIDDHLKECINKGGFYLGLYDTINNKYEWCDYIIEHHKNLSKGDIPMFNINNGKKKKPIRKQLRRQVWTKEFNKKIDGICPCCRNTKFHIMDSWECGHIVPESKGGKTMLSNLKPICSTCNKSMGDMNYHTFKKMIGC